VSARTPLFMLLGWMLICAPTPGAVGSCGTDELDNRADFSSYCQQREQLACVRQFLRKEITEDAQDKCRWDAIDMCARSAFPSDCRPTRRQTEACLNALSSFDTLKTKEADIPECKQKALCKGAPAQVDAGVDNP
jgi:hypothetical protein